jgi:hypothetical protein
MLINNQKNNQKRGNIKMNKYENKKIIIKNAGLITEHLD